jgi:hypothetical protein
VRKEIQKRERSQAWWPTSKIPALRRLRQEDCELQASLSYSETVSKKKIEGEIRESELSHLQDE